MSATTDKLEYIYSTIPVKYLCVYQKILFLLADYGIDMLKDCKASCTDRNSNVIDCFNMFNAAVANYTLGKVKEADVIIKYVKAKLNQLHSNNKQETFVTQIDANGTKALVTCGEEPKVEILENPTITPGDAKWYNVSNDRVIKQKPMPITAHPGVVYNAASIKIPVKFIQKQIDAGKTSIDLRDYIGKNTIIHLFIDADKYSFWDRDCHPIPMAYFDHPEIINDNVIDLNVYQEFLGDHSIIIELPPDRSFLYKDINGIIKLTTKENVYALGYNDYIPEVKIENIGSSNFLNKYKLWKRNGRWSRRKMPRRWCRTKNLNERFYKIQRVTTGGYKSKIVNILVNDSRHVVKIMK